MARSEDNDGDGVLGPCPICGRTMLAGPTVNRHHWVPRSKGGNDAADLHVVCHRMLHRLFSETELATLYNTPEAARVHPKMARFIAWVRRKPADFVDRPRSPRDRDPRRPHRRR